jgi:phosphoribosylamine--glycine ligase
MSDAVDTLILGGGGREHALAYALSKSKAIGKLHCAPGNPGIASLAEIHKINECDAEAMLSLCVEREIGLVIIGPEAPLVDGVAGKLRDAGISVFGPDADGARLEGSKGFSKSFMKRYEIQTAPFDICRTHEECETALMKRKPPFVIKADGLAAGKGVFLPENYNDAINTCCTLLSGKTLGGAGRIIIIEDYLRGKELTVFAITDGKSFRLLPPSRDHKRTYDGDMGPNTGGMGAYAPVTIPDGLLDRVAEEVLKPTLSGLASEGIDYRGVIYMGLMLSDETSETKISVVEYNVRFGDPETQVVLPLLQSDFGLLVKSTAEGSLGECPETGVSGSALCVILTSGGYPGNYLKGMRITGLDDGIEQAGSIVFHSGTASDGKGNFVTNGGRVLSVVGMGSTFETARERAYEKIKTLRFNNMHYRRDIGWSEATRDDNN